MALHVKRRLGNCLRCFLDPEGSRLRAAVDDHHHDHPARGAKAFLRWFEDAIDGMLRDLTVVARRSPTEPEAGERIVVVSFRVLLPIRISLIDGVSSIVVLALKGFKELIDYTLLRPKTKEEEPDDQGNDYDRDCSANQAQPSLGRPGIVLLRIQQSHKRVSFASKNLKPRKNLRPDQPAAWTTGHTKIPQASRDCSCGVRRR